MRSGNLVAVRALCCTLGSCLLCSDLRCACCRFWLQRPRWAPARYLARSSHPPPRCSSLCYQGGTSSRLRGTLLSSALPTLRKSLKSYPPLAPRYAPSPADMPVWSEAGLLAAMGFGYGICSGIAKGDYVPVAMPAVCMQSFSKRWRVGQSGHSAGACQSSTVPSAREHGNRHNKCAAAE